jgi:CheY-like chemotaxis protein
MPEVGGQDNASITVLVADDNDVAQRLCKRVLEKAGYNVLIAADGLQAVEVALKKRPAMILMDVAMPGIDGIEAMKRIKAEIPNQPIVIASAHSMASDRERFLAAGADDILSKPFRLADLVAASSGQLADDHIAEDSVGNYVHAPGKTIVTIGVNDLIVVETDDVLFIAAKDRAEEVKAVVDRLAREEKEHLL